MLSAVNSLLSKPVGLSIILTVTLWLCDLLSGDK